MDLHIGYIMTVSNSIIGVSILAMPYCFKQCGVILAILMLLASGIISRLTCHYLLKSATMARRRTFELLSFHIFGTMGKLMVELGIIGFLMGTCIAFFVIIGDLGPAIIAKVLEIEQNDSLRTTLLVCVAFFCVLPLGLLKNVESLGSVSTATIGFYFCLVLKTIAESASHFTNDDWNTKVEMWKPHGVLQCLPIFAMALSCQTQLFEIYETLPNASLEKMNYVVRSAVNICTCVYVCVGFFGYVAFVNYPFTGNILMSFSPSVMTDAMKIGFVLSVACSFPLVIFPCRNSLYSLLFKKGYTPYEGVSNFIPETRFKLLTLFIVGLSLMIGIMIPNIEVVLGLLGSTIGTMICVIFPVTCFISISTKNTNERILAQIMLFIGVLMMVLGTYANLYAMEEISIAPVHLDRIQLPIVNPVIEVQPMIKEAREKYGITLEKVKENKNIIKDVIQPMTIPIPIEEKIQEIVQEIRHEPPQPVEPQDDIKPVEIVKPKDIMAIKLPEKLNNQISLQFEKKDENQIEKQTSKPDEVDKAAIEKEDAIEKEEAKEKQKENDTNKGDDEKAGDLLASLEKHKQEQKNLIQQQKQLLEEIKKETKELKDKHIEDIKKEKEFRLKAANQIVEIAKKAIESLGPQTNGGENAEKIIRNQNIINDVQKLVTTNNVMSVNVNNKNDKLNISKNAVVTENKKDTNGNKDIYATINKTIPNKNMIPLPILVNNIRENNSKDVDNIKQNKQAKELNKTIIDSKNTYNKPILEKDNKKETKNEISNIKLDQNKIGNEINVKEISLIDKIKDKVVTEKVDTKIGRDLLSKTNNEDYKTEISQTVKVNNTPYINDKMTTQPGKTNDTKILEKDIKSFKLGENKTSTTEISIIEIITEKTQVKPKINAERVKREVMDTTESNDNKNCEKTSKKPENNLLDLSKDIVNNINIKNNLINDLKFNDDILKTSYINLRKRK